MLKNHRRSQRDYRGPTPPNGTGKKFHNGFGCVTGTNIYMKSYV